jgi:predicted pyridoxine 5'-phosphate oxidase superfamily flavin-nucleotide-binding protein
MKFHEGEIAVQTRAGGREMAAKIGGGIRATIAPERCEFVARQPLAVLGTIDQAGRPWVSVITGEPGFMRVLEGDTVRIAALPPVGDPLLGNLNGRSHVAMLIPEFAARRRLRLNGWGQIADGAAIIVRPEQVYGNCPRYIQARVLVGRQAWSATGGSSAAVKCKQLSPEHQRLIARADTMFIATDHPRAGADVSHRGGNPGFVRVIDAGRLAIPDYAGNRMFNTLGNIAANPRAGLLFVDFESGRTLQLTGLAAIDWHPARAAAIAGAERVVDFTLDEAIDNPHGFALRYTLHDYSEFNP